MKRSTLAAVLSAVLVLTGCSKGNTSSVSSSTSNEPQNITDTGHAGEESKHPNDVTDYDRTAVTSLINMDLKNRFGKYGYGTVYEDYIDFEKKDGILTASGNYICYENGYELLGFTYKYADEFEQYSLISADVGQEAGEDENVGTAALGKEPDRSYDVGISKYITVTFTHDGDGMCRIVLVDENGKEAAEVLNQNGTIDTVKTVEVEPGQYKLNLYCTGGGWSMSYSTAE